MRTASIILNAIIVAVTTAILVSYFRNNGRWDRKKGLSAFRFFTVLSNAFSALACCVMLIAQIHGGPSGAVLMLKYLGANAVSVTMLTVLFFLGPTAGYREMYARDNLYMHLIGPVLAIASYCFLEAEKTSFSSALWGFLPVALYGIVYLYKVVLAGPQDRWEDFYGFNKKGLWPVSFAGMLLLEACVCWLLWALS